MSARNRGNKGNSNRNHRSHATNNQSNKNINRRGTATPSFNGIYANKSMCHALTALVGAKCQVRTKNQENVYEGFFHCFSPKMDIIVSAAHKLNKGGGDVPVKNEIIDDMIFPIEEVVSFSFENTDLSYAIEDNFTDNAISAKEQRTIDNDEKYNNLQQWQPESGDDCEIDGDLGEIPGKMAGSGWAADEMFRLNTEKYGVKTSYDSKLTEYTVALKKDECTTEDVRRAHNLAREIESSQNYQINVKHELDESVDDETKFSAVDENAPPENQKGKYIPPSRRENTPQLPVNGGKAGTGPKPPQQTQSPGRVSRNNSESESKNKRPNQKHNQNQQSISQNQSPMGSSKKEGMKKDNRNRSSPTQSQKSQSRTQPSQSQNQVRNLAQNPAQGAPVAWNTIAGRGTTGHSQPSPDIVKVTGAMKRPLQPTPVSDNRQKTEDLKNFSSNFILKPDEKTVTPKNDAQNITQTKPGPEKTSQNPPPVSNQPTQTINQTGQTKRKTTPPPGMEKKPAGPPPGMQKQPDPKMDEKVSDTPKAATKLNPEAKEWRPNASAPVFKPVGFTPKSVPQQPQPPQQQPQTPQINPQSPPVNPMPQQPQYIPQAPYAHQQPLYPYPGYQQPGGFVPMPPQQIIHQGQPVPYTTPQPMNQPSVSQAPNQGGPKPRTGTSGGRPDRIRHPAGQTGSPHNQPMGQPGIMPGGQQGNMISQPNMGFHPGQVNQQPMIYQPDMVVPSIQHVGIQQRGPFDPNYQNYPQPMAPQTPTSQGPGQVVYHSGHPNQPGPNQIQMQPGAGHIISYQIAQPGQQPGMAPAMHPQMYHPHPPRPQQMGAPPGGQGGYPGQPQPGQHPQQQH